MRCGCSGADSSDHASSCCSAVDPSLARRDLTSFMSYLQVVGCVIIADAWGGWMDAIMHRKVEGLHAHLPPGLHHIIFLPLQTKLLTILSPKSVMGIPYFPDETARNPQPFSGTCMQVYMCAGLNLTASCNRSQSCSRQTSKHVGHDINAMTMPPSRWSFNSKHSALARPSQAWAMTHGDTNWLA